MLLFAMNNEKSPSPLSNDICLMFGKYFLGKFFLDRLGENSVLRGGVFKRLSKGF
jgi:hypothetical protein